MLDPSTLSSALLSAWSAYPATTLLAATNWANAYDAYALQAQACNGLTPTVLNKPGLLQGIKDAIDSGGSYSAVANAIASAHETYWTAGKFGATGTVTLIAGTGSLKSGLESLWQAQAITLTLFPASAAAHAALFDVFTKSVQVTDTAIPAPSGCGPLVIG